METETTCNGRGFFEINWVGREKGENPNEIGESHDRQNFVFTTLLNSVEHLCYRESSRKITVSRFY